MLETKAVFDRKINDLEARDCAVEKVIRLSGAEFDRFSENMLRDWNFIRSNNDLMYIDSEDKAHCLLVVGEGRRDGVLVNSGGADFARYSAFLPNADMFLAAERHPALVELAEIIVRTADYIAAQAVEGKQTVIDLDDVDMRFDINLSYDNPIRDAVLGLLCDRPEIAGVESDNREIVLYGSQPEREDEPAKIVTPADMYAYGYSWDGMKPFSSQTALARFDAGREVYLLYDDGTEAAAKSREDVEKHDGIFGAEVAGYQEKPANERAPVEVFILNQDRYFAGTAVGEWLMLPAGAEELRELFSHVGLAGESGDSYVLTAFRSPYKHIQEALHLGSNLDELNMLASYLRGMEAWELDKLQAVLSSGLSKPVCGAAGVINLLCGDNFSGFVLLGAKNEEELGRYWAEEEPNAVPVGMSPAKYGRECVRVEKGVFTEWGYIYNQYKGVEQEFTGVVPYKYRITGEALRAAPLKTPERQDVKPSVLKQLREARNAPKPPYKKDPDRHKGDAEL
jgi:hypothetical protein